MNFSRIFIFLAFMSSGTALGQTDQPVKAHIRNLSHTGEFFHVDCNIKVESLKIADIDALVIAPELSDGTNSYELPRVVVNGPKRQKLFLRNEYFGTEDEVYANAYKVIAYEKKPITVHYDTKIPYEAWMKDADLILKQEKCACPNQAKIMDEIIVHNAKADTAPAPEPAPAPVVEERVLYVSFMQPKKEVIKNRFEYGESFLNFKVGKSDILHNFMDNNGKLEQVSAFFRRAQEDKNIKVHSIIISGYTSPEGTYDYNMNLSMRRATAFANWIQNSFSFPASVYQVDWYGEDWEGLRKMVAESQMPEKYRILNIIDNVGIFAGRETKLMNIDNGRPYKFMLANYFPHFRRIVYRIEYTVRAFSSEEGRQLIDTKPEQLSVFEMYEVANSFDRNSKEFREIIKKATERASEDPAMKNNAAAVALSEQRLEEAEELLNQVPDCHEKFNNIGVQKMLNGEYGNAAVYFEKAKELGSEDAKKNIEILEQQLKKLGLDRRGGIDAAGKTSKTIPYILK